MHGLNVFLLFLNLAMFSVASHLAFGAPFGLLAWVAGVYIMIITDEIVTAIKGLTCAD
jgi:hypothetical protein